MKFVRPNCLTCLMLVFASTAFAQSSPAPVASPLQDYLNLPDKTFAWKLNEKIENPLGKIYDVELASQAWMDMTWKHVMMVYEPADLKHKDHVLLFITGGGNLNKPSDGDRMMGLLIAKLCGARVAMVHQVPNQPLLGGRKEDDLITDTFLFHLATGDKRWPLLFPMVKSAIRAMDCVEQLAEKEWNAPVKGFVVTGASKRGWTTWLTGASDKRVVGIAPIVIDTLNFPKQMDYQIETWGRYSEQIEDYERKGLIKHLQEDSDFPLWRWVDPWFYRDHLTLPKLIINGTNDRYWTVDALNVYWNDLSGDKYIRYVPNAGHSLQGGREGAFATLGVFFQHVIEGKALPAIDWKHETLGDALQLTIKSNQKPTAVRLWKASSATKDFRESKWEAKLIKDTNGDYIATLPKPADGHVALYGEVQFHAYGQDYTLTTQIRRE
ncbi:PhoPQ-activated pathogenicity-related family protein [Schlesneria sp. T3-172]|uniref:PhoPQ-activated pathogenicity-related family protein n=1 Tax=Schlesneria sphaerica TaxID=3373610 RepID=UPI0037C9260E